MTCRASAKSTPLNMSRILRLNQLAPQIKKAILDGTQSRQLSLQDMQTPFPDVWDEQLKHFGFVD